jgi:hypothetical protein
MNVISDKFDSKLTSASFFQSPWATYQELRKEAPIYKCKAWGQWVVTKHVDVSFMLKNPQMFSSEGWEERYLSQLPSNSREILPSLYSHYETRVVSNVDPPDHTRLRKLINRSFTPRSIEALSTKVEVIVSKMLNDEHENESSNFVTNIAYPLPAIVIALLLGAPEEDRALFEKWSADIVAFVGSGSPKMDLAMNEEKSIAEFQMYLGDLIKARQKSPKDDLLSALISKSDDEDSLSHNELISTCITLLFAGHETTANLLSSSLLEILRNPSHIEILTRNPELAHNAVEETLRYNSPVQRIRRVARENVELGGVSIHKGALVMGFIGSANRDEELFENPEIFDITRKENPHLAFGGGIHFCIGAALSRLEAPIVLNSLFSQFPKTKLALGFVEKYRENMTFRGLESLEVEYSR